MGSIRTYLENAYRDFTAPSDPATGAYKPEKAILRGLGPLLEYAISRAGLGALVSDAKPTAAELSLALKDKSVALVFADEDDSANDLWLKTGAPGAGFWTNTGALHGIIGELGADGLATVTDAAAAAAADLGAIVTQVDGAVDEARGYAETLSGVAEEAAGAAALLEGAQASIAGSVATTTANATTATAAKTASEAARDQTQILRDQTVTATSVSPFIQKIIATPTVPPAGVASGSSYWALTATNYQLYTNTAGTGVIVPGATSPLGSTVEQLQAVLRPAGNDPSDDANMAFRFRDSLGAILAALLKDSAFRARAYELVDPLGNFLRIGAEAGALTMPSFKIGGTQFAAGTRPGFALQAYDANGAIFFEIPLDPTYMNPLQIAAALRRLKASRPYLTGERLATSAIIIDDARATDPAIAAIFAEYGITLNYAVEQDHLTADNAPFYQKQVIDGSSILAHSKTHPHMDAASALTDAEAEAQMADSKAVIEGYGIPVSGWVTPYSDLKAAWVALVRKYFGYGFTKQNAGVFTETVKPWNMDRLSLETFYTNAGGGTAGLAAVKARIDLSITNKELGIWYFHDLSIINEAVLRELLVYFKLKRDSGLLRIYSADEAVYQYYRATA